MAIYEVTLRGSYFGQETINRWDYVSSGTPGGTNAPIALIEQMGGVPIGDTFPSGTIFLNIRGNVADNYHFEGVQIVNLYDPADFYEFIYSPPIVGEVDASEGLSPINAFGFVSNQVTRAIRKGHKRFAGVPEAAVGDGGVLTGTAITAMTALAVAMSAVLVDDTEGSSLHFTPAILSKEKHAPDSRHAKEWYSFYATEADQLAHAAVGVSWAVMPDVRSQVSRQYGRGR